MRRLILPFSLFLVSCGDERPPAPTPEQSEQLDEAQAMLDNLAGDEGQNKAQPPAPD